MNDKKRRPAADAAAAAAINTTIISKIEEKIRMRKLHNNNNNNIYRINNKSAADNESTVIRRLNANGLSIIKEDYNNSNSCNSSAKPKTFYNSNTINSCSNSSSSISCISCSSSSYNTDNSNENLVYPKIHESKERVEILELENNFDRLKLNPALSFDKIDNSLKNRNIFNNYNKKRWRINREKLMIHSILNNHHNTSAAAGRDSKIKSNCRAKISAAPRSCSDNYYNTSAGLFDTIKYPKKNYSFNDCYNLHSNNNNNYFKERSENAGNNFIDYKIVEKDCIDANTHAVAAADDDDIDHPVLEDEENNEMPIGNPELISVMKESLDKIMKENLKSCKLNYINSDGIHNDADLDRLQRLEPNNLDSNSHAAVSKENLEIITCSNEIHEIKQNSVTLEPVKNEILLESSDNLLQQEFPRSNEYLVQNDNENHRILADDHELQKFSTNFKDQELNLEPKNDDDRPSSISKKTVKECCTCGREKFSNVEGMKSKRVNFSPRNLISKESNPDDDDHINCKILQLQKGEEILQSNFFNGCIKKSVPASINDSRRPTSAPGSKKCKMGNNRNCLTKNHDNSALSQNAAKSSSGSVIEFSQNCVQLRIGGEDCRPESSGSCNCPNLNPRKINCRTNHGCRFADSKNCNNHWSSEFANQKPGDRQKPEEICCRNGISIPEIKSPDKIVTQYNNSSHKSNSKPDYRSKPCNLHSCNHRSCMINDGARICCRKISTHNRISKSTPVRRRKVTFCLPSLIPEELENSYDRLNHIEDSDKTTTVQLEEENINNSAQICKCQYNDRAAGIESSILTNERNKFGKNFTRENEFFHSNNNQLEDSQHCCNNVHKIHCNCCYNGSNRHADKSKNPRVLHFCREIITKHRDIVNGDLDDRDIKLTNNEEVAVIEFCESKSSVSSAEEWNDDNSAAAGAEQKDNLNSLIQNISFPKETRQAMSVLLQSRERNSKLKQYCAKGKEMNQTNMQKGVKISSKKPADLEISKYAIKGQEQPKRVQATYAQALAVFQMTRDPLQEGGRCKKKRHIVWKGNDGEIHSEYTSASLDTLEGINQQDNNNNNRRRIDNTINNNCEYGLNRTFNVPKHKPCTGVINTMQTNGSENGSSENGVDRTGWTVGLINGRFKYLTAETFGFKINANGASLKKKQLWTLEGSEHQVFLRSHLDRYLAVDQFGNVTCEAEDTADPGCAFQIQVASDGSGRWALKNIQRGYFLGSSQDELKCTAKVPGDAEYWLVHLAARPQVNLRSAGRKRFAHLSAAQDEIHVDAPVPWGEDTLFTLEFRPAAMPDNIDGNGDVRRDVRSEAGIGGHYALHTCNNKYLARDGKLLDSCTRDCLYAAEFHAGMLALRDVSGAYLAPIGSKAVLKSRSNTVTRDELFSLEDSLPQASFVAALNQRYVSVKQGVDVTANQDEISGHETFQLEFDRATKRWYLRTMQDRYWTLEAGGGIQASDHKRSSNALFDLVWQPADGTVALRANNGKFLATKRSGHLYANADSPGDNEASKFYFYLMNRPVLVLRCEQGFVGLKSNSSPKLECNKASYETIRVERCDRGIVRFKGQNAKYWHADSEGVTSDADVPSDGFYLELREPSRICIKSTDGRYLSAGKNGVFRLGDTDYESATKWEF